MPVIQRLALFVLLGVAVTGQSISVTNNPVAPGGVAQITVSNNAFTAIGYTRTAHPLHVFQPTGELAFPFDLVGGIQGWMQPLTSVTLNLAVPPAGPGSSGSFVLHYMDGDEAVTRLDVGTPSPVFPHIHCWPARSHDFLRGHSSPVPAYGTGACKFANVSTVPHTFGSGDYVFVFRPTLSAPILTVPLAGTTVPAGGVACVDVSILPLAPGPIRVLTTWLDPGTYQTETRSHGLRRHDSHADLHLPAGKTIPQGGSLPVMLAAEGFPASILGGPPGGIPFFALAAALSSGEMFLGQNLALPLAPGDPLLLPSLATGLGGFLQNNVGQGLPVSAPTLAGYTGASMYPLVSVVHPSIPSLSGVSLHVAALAFDPISGTLGVSQREVLVVE